MTVHTVSRGESIDEIAKEYGVSAEEIIKDNELREPYKITRGETLVIRFPTKVYIAKCGETMRDVARKFDTSECKLYRGNPHLCGSELKCGERINISFNEPRLPAISVNGYAYPSIERTALEKALPFLTTLTLFGGRFLSDGTAVLPNDRDIIEICEKYGAVPMLQVSNIDSMGNYSPSLASDFLSDENAKRNLISRLIEACESRKYGGVEIDFEFADKNDYDKYADFICELRKKFAPHDGGFFVHVTHVPHACAEDAPSPRQYTNVYKNADALSLLSSLTMHTFDLPAPSSPLSKVLESTDEACILCSPQKILLGIPTFGYDFSLAENNALKRAAPASCIKATAYARDFGIPISRDEKSASPYFTYETKREGVPEKHIVHFEDALSLEAKLNAVAARSLGGVSALSIMEYMPSFWLLLSSMFSITRPYEWK